MEKNFFVDIHCHTSTKSYGYSYETDTPGIPSHSHNKPSSLWFRDRPTVLDKVRNITASLTNFIQSDPLTLLEGHVGIVFISFYPQEKGFFINKLGHSIIADVVTNIPTQYGTTRINHIQNMDSYWEDLLKEMEFLKDPKNTKIEIDNKQYSYVLAKSFGEINEITAELGYSKIAFVPTIEGGHIFDQVIDCHEDYTKYPEGIDPQKIPQLMERVEKLRRSEDGYISPLFLTLAHHFWNGLCGHEISLGNLVKCVIDQTNGIGTGFTNIGKKVVDMMLKPMKDENGLDIRPIYIDIKHMSRTARLEYFNILETYNYNIPVIASHSCVTGLSEKNGKTQTPAAQEGLFNTDTINLFDDEILMIAKTGGILGIQLDERRIGSKSSLRNARGSLIKRKMLFKMSFLVWNQIRHIAELLDANGYYSWGIQTIGSDYDGIVNPINGYWSSKEMEVLDDYLSMHAYNYLKKNLYCPLTQERNRNIAIEEVIDRVMTSNALNFLSQYYI